MQTAATAPMSEATPYGARVRALFDAAPGAGAPADPRDWVRGEARDPLTGTHVRWHLRAEAGRIVEARWEVRGCPHTIAVAALLAGRLVGEAAAAPRIDPAALAAELEAPPEKLGRLFVIEDAVRSAALLLRPPGA